MMTVSLSPNIVQSGFISLGRTEERKRVDQKENQAERRERVGENTVGHRVGREKKAVKYSSWT